MNPRVGPSSKNGAVFQGKMGVFSELSEGISALIKEEDKSSTVNYDLSLLDVVHPKSIASKKHVHFLPDRTSVSPVNLKEQYRNYTKHHLTEKRCETPTNCAARKDFKDLNAAQSGSSSSSSSIQVDDDNCETLKVSSPKLPGKQIPGKQIPGKQISSPRIQKKSTTHQNNTHGLDETKQTHTINNEYPNKNLISKEFAQFGKPKTNRSLPSTPLKTPVSSPSIRKSIKHKSLTGSKKDIATNQTVRFAEPVSNSRNSTNKSSSNTDFITQNSLLTENAIKNSASSNKEEQNATNSGNLSQSSKSSLPIRRTISATEENGRPMKLNHSTSSLDDNQSNHCTRTKYVQPTSSNTLEVPDRRLSIGWHSRVGQSKRDSNHVNRRLANPDLSSNLNSSPLKRTNQPKHDSQPELVNEDKNLTLPVSSSTLNKETKPLYDLSSVISTVFSKLPRDENVSADLKQMSTSASGSLSSTAATSFKFKTRRSTPCLEKDCVYRKGLDCNASSNLAQNDQKSGNTPLSALFGKQRDATLSDLEPNSPSAVVKKFDQSLLPFSSTRYRNMASLVKKESIAASYQLDYCWFCGRPMSTCDLSANDQDDLLQKLAEIKRLLAEAEAEKKRLLAESEAEKKRLLAEAEAEKKRLLAESEAEKIKFLEEQVRLRNSKMEALQKNEALEKELRQMKMKDNKEERETPRPMTSALSNTSKDFDLRAHLEGSGHQLDTCPHIFVSRHTCRGFLHKMGGRFRMWRKWWFVLDITKRKVLYFTDKTETKLKGSISLQAIDEVYVDHHRIVRSPNPKLTFCVKTCERTYQFVAPSPDSMTIWVDALFSVAEGYHRMSNSHPGGGQ